jgi:hypothetical protein
MPGSYADVSYSVQPESFDTCVCELPPTYAYSWCSLRTLSSRLPKDEQLGPLIYEGGTLEALCAAWNTDVPPDQEETEIGPAYESELTRLRRVEVKARQLVLLSNPFIPRPNCAHTAACVRKEVFDELCDTLGVTRQG